MFAGPRAAPAAGETGGPASAKLLSVELSGRDVEFLQGAARGGTRVADLASRLIALCESPAMRVLASEIAEKEKALGAEIAALGAEKGVPTGRIASGKKKKDPYAELQGPKLEKRIIQELLAVSAERLTLFESFQESADREIRRVAVRHAPVLREMHRRLARLAGVAES